MNKRILCLLLVFALMLGACAMLASCGKKGEEETPRDPSEFDEQDRNVSKYYEYTWSTTSLNVELSEHSCAQELIPRVRRYLAGQDASANDPIDEDVRRRNGNAEKVTRTKINYTYLQDIDTYAWGKNISRIANESKSYSDTSADIYINFIYDMVGAQLQGAFANLRSTSMYNATGINFFEFTASDYDAATDDEGYMYDLMNSLSFSTRKMYVLTSDYLTDVVRAFFVVPVNIEMVNGIDVTMVERYDYDQNGVFDIEDFFGIVWNYDWNYEAVKVLSQAVANQVGEEPSLMDDTHGFALGTGVSGIHGVGILYGTDVEIIDRTLNNVTGYYEVSYPESAGAYGDFCDALASLFETPGVTNIAGGSTSNTPSMKITQLFANNQILLGGVICAGNLEQTEYQTMNAEGQGFGVAPVPMYREFNAAIDVDANNQNRYYRTASHNIAKCAGISVATTKFKQCSAWLDYQSTHSTDILNQYYEDKLQYAFAGNNPHNVKVLEVLRNNVSTALDKCYDDAVKAYSGQTDMRWCYLIRKAQWKPLEIRTDYSAAVELKAAFLQQIQDKYDKLPE